MSTRSRARSITLLTAAALVLTGSPALAAPPPQRPGAPPLVPAADQLVATAETYPEADTTLYTVSVARNGVPEELGGFALDVQQVIDAALDDLETQGPTPADPLLVLNPYGTNTTGVLARFGTEGGGTLTYTVSSPGTEDFTRVAEDHDPSDTAFEGQLIGVVPGAENTVTTTWQPDDGEAAEFSFTLTAPASASGDRTTLERTVEGDAEELTDGLFAVIGLRRHVDYTLLYDNAGVLRAEFDLDGYRTDRLEFYDGTMVTTVGTNRVARIDGLGRVVATHVLPGYEMHHDFDVTDDGKVVILATETAKDSVEDVLVSLDLGTGAVEKTVDFSELLADYTTRARPYGPDNVDDWLHLNSVDWSPDGDSVIVSSRETSAILKVDDVHGSPALDYVIGQAEVWAGTEAENSPAREGGGLPRHRRAALRGAPRRRGPDPRPVLPHHVRQLVLADEQPSGLHRARPRGGLPGGHGGPCAALGVPQVSRRRERRDLHRGRVRARALLRDRQQRAGPRWPAPDQQRPGPDVRGVRRPARGHRPLRLRPRRPDRERLRLPGAEVRLRGLLVRRVAGGRGGNGRAARPRGRPGLSSCSAPADWLSGARGSPGHREKLTVPVVEWRTAAGTRPGDRALRASEEFARGVRTLARRGGAP